MTREGFSRKAIIIAKKGNERMRIKVLGLQPKPIEIVKEMTNYEKVYTLFVW